MPTPKLFEDLEAEWRRLSTDPDVAAAVRRWGEEEPALAGLVDAGEILVRSARGDPLGADAILGALLRLAARDRLAVRVLLQAVLPGVRARVRRVSRRGEPGGRPLPGWADVDELAADLVGMTIERIHQLAGTGPTWVASALVDGAWRRLRNQASAAQRAEAGMLPLWEDLAVAARPARSAAEALGQVVSEAVSAGRLSRRAGAVLFSTRVLGYSTGEVAARSGRDVRAVRAQRARAERALIAVAS